MLTDVAARVLARRARFGTEAWGEGGEADRLRQIVEDLLADRVGQADLGGGDEPAAVGGAEQVIGKLRQLSGAVDCLIAYQQRRRTFDVAALAGLEIQYELRQRPLQPRH